MKTNKITRLIENTHYVEVFKEGLLTHIGNSAVEHVHQSSMFYGVQDLLSNIVIIEKYIVNVVKDSSDKVKG